MQRPSPLDAPTTTVLDIPVLSCRTPLESLSNAARTPWRETYPLAVAAAHALPDRRPDEVAAEQCDGDQHDPGVRQSAKQDRSLAHFHELSKNDAHLDERDHDHAGRDDRAGSQGSVGGVVYPQISQRQRRQDQPYDQQPFVEFHPSPHHVQHRKDEYPQKVNGVPVGGARLDELLRAARRTPKLVDDDAEDDETDQQMNEVNPGEKEVVGEELAAVQAISRADQPDPLEHL